MKTTTEVLDEVWQKPHITYEWPFGEDMVFIKEAMIAYASHVRDEDRKMVVENVIVGKKGAFGTYWNRGDLVVDNDSILNAPKQELK